MGLCLYESLYKINCSATKNRFLQLLPVAGFVIPNKLMATEI